MSGTAEPPADPLELFRQLDRQVRSLHSEPAGLVETLDRVVVDVVRHVPGAQYASLSQTTRRETIVTVAASDPLVSAMDEAQDDAGEGPCVTTLYEHRTVLVEDWRTEQRWPRVRQAYLDAGLRSGLCFQLFIADQDLGALNLFSTRPGAFDDRSTLVAEHFATHAAVAMRGAASRDQWERAVASRDVIGQAKGVLMARHGLSADQAFAVLVRHSRDGNVKLQAVAEQVARTGGVTPA